MAESLRDICLWCDEPLGDDPGFPVATFDGVRFQHQECALRSVVGGIGHLVAHEYWCLQLGDPDAGLTSRQSAVLAHAWVHAVGLPGERTDQEPDSA